MPAETPQKAPGPMPVEASEMTPDEASVMRAGGAHVTPVINLGIELLVGWP